VRSESAVIKPDFANPLVDDARILTRGDVRTLMRSALEEVLTVAQGLVCEQPLNRLPSHLRDFELYRTFGLQLSDDRTIANDGPGTDVLDLEANQVRRSQLAVDRKVEQGEVPCRGSHLESNTDRPHLPRQQWSFLSDDEAFVPRATNLDGGVHGNILAIPPAASLPRALHSSLRAGFPLRHKPELEDDLQLRRNWERADLMERLNAVDTSTELRPHAIAPVARRDIGWDVLAQLVVAISKHVPVICAAGNDGESQLIYPANLAADDNGIVAVGAVSGVGCRSGYSNYGEGLTLVAPSDDGEVYNRHQIRIDRTDPMVDQHAYVAGTATPVPYSPLALLTTDLPGSLGYAQGVEPFASIFPPLPGAGMGGGLYTAFGGTSGASALVGGVVALAARAHKTAQNDATARLTGPQMKALLVAACSLDARVTPGTDKLTRDPMNADNETSKPMSYFFGAGLVDAKRLVESILSP
jgi:hypothetical protein